MVDEERLKKRNSLLITYCDELRREGITKELAYKLIYDRFFVSRSKVDEILEGFRRRKREIFS